MNLGVQHCDDVVVYTRESSVVPEVLRAQVVQRVQGIRVVHEAQEFRGLHSLPGHQAVFKVSESHKGDSGVQDNHQQYTSRYDKLQDARVRSRDRGNGFRSYKIVQPHCRIQDEVTGCQDKLSKVHGELSGHSRQVLTVEKHSNNSILNLRNSFN